MRSLVIILSLLICTSFCAQAQNTSASASQRVVLQLNPIIEFSSAIKFNESKPELKITSNSNFIINAEKATMSQSGMRIVSNGTQDILANGSRGTDQVFAVNNTNSKKIANGNADITVYTATAP